MSVSSGPGLINSGLVLCLDATNSRSYPGSGTTWYDLSQYGRNASLINAPAYSSTAIKYFILNGTDQYASIANFTGINFNVCTIVYVAYLDTSPNSRNTIFSQYYGGNGTQFEWSSSGDIRSGFRQNSASTPENNAAGGSLQAVLGIPIHVTATYANGTVTHYKNGALMGSTTNVTQTDVNGGGNIEIGRNSSAGLYFKGRVYSVAIYDKVLTPREITFNFNSVRGRYGL